MQTTLKTSVRFDGIGLHSGKPVTMVVRPAPSGRGITFRRTDIEVGNALVPARWNAVVPSKLCTLLRNDAGAEVSTVEHIMAALAGCGVTNALIDIDGPEAPIMDGSSAPFVDGILSVGLVDQDGPTVVLEILETVEVRDGDVVARLSPSNEMRIDFDIDFADAAIGRQSMSLNMANGSFVRELSHCRTFCRQSDVDAMRDNGLALGGTLENAVVIDGDTVVSPGGFRTADEAVRHKMLDALGDLALAGAPILGRYTGIRAGHAMTNKLLRKLFATDGAWRFVQCDASTARRLPGVGVRARDIPVYA
ncbi:UDP-3-O-acyl-N-acetylglucosamine deacetylase [Aliiroseovarius sp. PTFE2010]|uniref:UDP-3-O-acyl-N-acetylglucosamine deacetylase n=1 Tax=Aliiroseovarius sp. PTFE2010 TaxID=3417190 RepID=UPI003CF4DE08